ncbi:MAG: hypothetical protein QXL10_01725 [Candidatus Bathyarchaeia archaeon]
MAYFRPNTIYCRDYRDVLRKFPDVDAHDLKEACQLLETGFEYVTDMEGVKLFRKRK